MHAAAVIAVSAIAGAAAAGVFHLFAEAGPAAAPSAPAPSEPAAAAGVERRLDDLERRLAEVAASVARWNEEAVRARAESVETERALRDEVAAVKAAVASAASAAATAPPSVEQRPSDRMAGAMASAMRQGIRQEFKRIADLVSHPTPEAEEARRRQIDMFAGMFARQAGLDDTETSTVKRIFQETDAAALRALRPVLQGTERVEDLDYPSLRTITQDSFEEQDRKFEAAFSAEKAEALKRQVAPIRTVFTATLDELEAAAKAEKAAAAGRKE